MSYSLQHSEEYIKELFKIVLKPGGVYMIYDSDEDIFRNYKFLVEGNNPIGKKRKDIYTFEKDIAPEIIKKFVDLLCDSEDWPLSFFHIVPVVLFPEGVYKADFSEAISFMEMFE